MSAGPYIGVDMGGTKIACGLVDETGRILARHTVPTERIDTPEELRDVLAHATREWRGAGHAPRGIGVGVPGWVDAEAGLVRSLVNVPWDADVALGPMLTDATDLPVILDNDANVMTLAEARLGAGRGRRHVVGITLGTGVGGGLLLDGALYHGARFNGGEIGHVSINARGPRCPCGANGCIEVYIARNGLVRDAKRRLRRAAGTRAAREIERLAGEEGDRVTPKVMARAADAGNPLACAFWETMGERFGAFLVSMTNLLNPECFIVGGGIAKARKHFFPAARRRLQAEAMNDQGPRTPVLAAKLGTKAGLVGAALLAAERFG